MMGSTTLREIREALAAVRSGEATTSATTPAAELESLALLLEGELSQMPSAPMAKASTKMPQEGPNPALVRHEVADVTAVQ